MSMHDAGHVPVWEVYRYNVRDTRPLRALDGTPAFIAAPKRDLEALFDTLGLQVAFTRRDTNSADIILPGGTMALIALTLDQWGPLPCQPPTC